MNAGTCAAALPSASHVPLVFAGGPCLGSLCATTYCVFPRLLCRQSLHTIHTRARTQDIPRQVLHAGLRPAFHPLAPEPYRQLAARCWSANPRV